MPQTPTNNNGQKPTNLRVEQSRVKCPGCKKIYDGLFLEQIEDLSQLRIGHGLVEHLRLRCTKCGELFNWNISDRVLQQMAIETHEIWLSIRAYNPE